MAHPFTLTHEIEVDAPPEVVWDAIATGPGVDSWFMGQNEVEQREGGKARTHLPGISWESTIATWQPPTHLVEQGEAEPGGAHHIFDYTIEPREKGRTLVRWVHSGALAGEDWEAQYEGMSEGDPMYFLKLAEYLTHFRGRTAVPVNVYGPRIEGGSDVAWGTYYRGFGLDGAVAMDQHVRLTPKGLPELDGVVDCLTPSFLGVRTDDGMYRFWFVWNDSVGMGHHIFQEGLDQGETERAWADWLNDLFAGVAA
jgi:uncharacterized protein YndB with AHSA1/START domain